MALMQRLLLFMLLLATNALSRTPAPLPAHAITGTVHDPSDAAIVGARVLLIGADGDAISQTITDKSGVFRFDRLDPGNYQVDVQKEGVREIKITMSLGTRPHSALRIVLPIFVVNQEVTVPADELMPQVSTDIAQNQNANTVDRAALDRVPVFDQDYVTTLSRFLDDSAIGTNGVTLVVNGVEANGPGVTASAVKEVKINQNPYSALYSRPGRASWRSRPRESHRDAVLRLNVTDGIIFIGALLRITDTEPSPLEVKITSLSGSKATASTLSPIGSVVITWPPLASPLRLCCHT